MKYLKRVARPCSFLVLLFVALSAGCGGLAVAAPTEEHQLDMAEMEKKPYQIGGYLEFYPILFGLDKSSALYKLNFFNRREGPTTEQYNGNLQLEGSLESGISRLYLKTYTSYINSFRDETTKTSFFEGNLSIKPSSSLSVDLGKKTLNWGKGYAWNPAAFLDRPKNPDDPELSREGLIVAALDYTKSFQGPLKTFSFTPVLIPAYPGVNDDFGETGHLNGAAKLYFLLYDTDIDLIFLTGGSRSTAYAMDFSRNITTNLEIHGELALINSVTGISSDSLGNTERTTGSTGNFLAGLRYLTGQDTTYILEYYRNGAGYSNLEMQDYFTFIDRGYQSYVSTGNAGLLNKAGSLFEGGYGRMNPARNYLYLRVSQKDPFDILYLTPAFTLIGNLDDRSFSLSPELLYTGITNLELRLRTAILAGGKGTEYGEKQNSYRVDFRARYYF